MSFYRRQDRHLPVRPNLDQLKHQARDLLRAVRRGDREAVDEFKKFHPEASRFALNADETSALPAIRLADAQLVLARSYGAASWARLVQACNLIAAIWQDDVDTVHKIVTENPKLLHENAGIRNSNWGPPMSYAANLGRDRIIEMLHSLGAKDHVPALIRAELQSQIVTARLIHKLMGSPVLSDGRMFLRDPAYTLSA